MKRSYKTLLLTTVLAIGCGGADSDTDSRGEIQAALGQQTKKRVFLNESPKLNIEKQTQQMKSKFIADSGIKFQKFAIPKP